jgi:hypothetical protein
MASTIAFPAPTGLTLTYRAADDVVLVEARPRVCNCVSEGGLELPHTLS